MKLLTLFLSLVISFYLTACKGSHNEETTGVYRQAQNTRKAEARQYPNEEAQRRAREAPGLD